MTTVRIFYLACALAVAACGGTQHAAAPDAASAAPDAPPPPDAGSGSGHTTSGVYLVDESFNAMATAAAPSAPWTTQGAVAIVEVPFAADKSVQLTGAATLARTVGPQQGRVVFEAKVLARDTTGFKAVPYLYDASDAAVASVAIQDGELVAHVGATITPIEPVVANVWYRVRVVVDTTAGTFDLYVDGIRMEHAAALRATATEVSRVAYYMDGPAPGTLLVDAVQVYTEAGYIGAPPAPVFDPRAYGATGDGTTRDTAAIQAAIAAATGTGGSVVLAGGTFLSGTLTLGSHMTFFVAPSAVLLGSTAVADYPTQAPATGNTQLANTQRALLYAPGVTDLTIDGGGMIDGQGDAFSGVESTRPLLIWTVLANGVTVRNLYLHKGAVWSLVTMETDHVLIDHVQLQSNNITHDGIDLVDGTDIVVQNAAINAGDDAMCLKSGVRRGLVGVEIRDSVFSGNRGGSNGIKLGTATYGAFQDISIHDVYVKDVQYAAMAVESRQGSDITGVTFQRVELANAGAAMFVYLAQQAVTHPVGDVPKLGSIDRVSFVDIAGRTASWPASPHQGSLITGQIYAGVTYPITNLALTRVAVAFDGGLGAVPAAPPEATPNQYPESNMFGDLPAAAYYLRHVQGVTFTAAATTITAPDARPARATDDVGGLADQ